MAHDMEDKSLPVVAGQKEVDQGADDDPDVVVDEAGNRAEEDHPAQKGDAAGDDRDHDLDDLDQNEDDRTHDFLIGQVGLHLGLAGKDAQLVPVDAQDHDDD